MFRARMFQIGTGALKVLSLIYIRGACASGDAEHAPASQRCYTQCTTYQEPVTLDVCAFTGIGYRLHMTTTEMPNVKHIIGFLKAVVEGAEVFLARRGFLVFSLGNPEHTKLVKLLKAIEANKRNLGIFTMGLAATSLEDVLLK